jgi:hypothetical protein
VVHLASIRRSPARPLPFWVAVLAAVAIGALFAASARYSFYFRVSRDSWLESEQGWVTFIYWNTTKTTTVYQDGRRVLVTAGFSSFGPRFLARRMYSSGFSVRAPGHDLSSPTMFRVSVPLPVPVAAALILAGWCWFRRRSGVPGLCSTCRYSLAGLPVGSARCPECGREIPVPDRAVQAPS